MATLNINGEDERLPTGFEAITTGTCSRWRRQVRDRCGRSKSLKAIESSNLSATIFCTPCKPVKCPLSELLSPVIAPLSTCSFVPAINSTLIFTLLLSTSFLNTSLANNNYQQQQQQQQAGNLIAPTIDYSHNMRILKLPQSTQVGSLIYRLKGSDGDPNTQLVFGVSGIEGRSLIDVLPVARSWNEADVYLRAPLEEQVYNLTIYVTDGNKTTQVESTIFVTDDNQQPVTDTNSDTNNNPKDLGLNSPFLNTKHVFHVPENTKPDEPIGFVVALESQKSDLPVRFELRGKGSDKFAIKYVFGPKGQSKADIVLAQAVDYEKQNLFSLKVLALNAWTNINLDTRNVATMDIVITVGDVQDSPPVFKNLPQSLRLFNTLQAGELVFKLEAEDGDYADQRPINYALDANSPLSNYFDIEKSSGEVRLRRSISELSLHAAWDSSAWSLLTVFASEVPDTSSYDHLWPLMYTKAEIPLMLVDLVNEPPQFIGGWQTEADSRLTGSTKTLHGYLNEPQLEFISTGGGGDDSSTYTGATLVRWFTNTSDTGVSLIDSLSKSMNGRPTVLDLGLGSNGTFELSLEGPDAALFQLDPGSIPVTKQTTFSLSVAAGANKSMFDHEQSNMKARNAFTLDIVAKDFGSPQRQSSRIRCLIELIDSNDNSPQFENDLYTFSVNENAQLGQLVGQVRAKDPDSKQAGRVRYTTLTGQESHLFKLNQENGQISLDGHLDREKRSSYLFLVEARDSNGVGHSNYSQVLITVIDVNDNAPTFLQPHYDAVLMADGTFHQPLVVRAIDNDEPNTANSQVAYEIIAGNQNEQFSIDTVSGAIYPANLDGLDSISKIANGNILPQIPSIINEPIKPFGAENGVASNNNNNNNNHHAGKILPSHEVEEATYPTPTGSIRFNRQNQFQSGNQSSSGEEQQLSNNYNLHNMVGSKEGASARSIEQDNPAGGSGRQGFTYNFQATRTTPYNAGGQPALTGNGGRLSAPPMDTEQLPALDLLLNLESEHQNSVNQFPRSLTTSPVYSTNSFNSMRVPPVTTLIVRAHDFGIPLRSSTVKVNIYNQALLTRSVSVILNGTAEQLEPRREAIERAFSSMTGSKASIESIDALSDSSSISVARVRLTVPQHSLVDLTDLSALMSALDYHTSQYDFRHHTGSSQVTHYIGNERFGPTTSSNITSGGQFLDSDMHIYSLDTSRLEGRLMLYIIIVGVCIFAVLAIWAICFCIRPSQVKIIEKTVPIEGRQRFEAAGSYRARQDGESQTGIKTYAKTADAGTGSPIANNLAKQKQQQPVAEKDVSAVKQDPSIRSTVANGGLMPPNLVAGMKPDHYSMYNGQVWFEPANQMGRFLLPRPGRRASSAPSAASLDSALHSVVNLPAGWRNQRTTGGRFGGSVTPRDATGQFFPNTIGYMENLAALTGMDERRQLELEAAYGRLAAQQQQRQQAKLSRRHRNRKVVPLDLVDGASELDGVATAAHLGAPNKPPRLSMRLDSGHSNEAFEQDLEAGSAANQQHQHQQQQQWHRSNGKTSETAAHKATNGRRTNSAASLSDQVSGSSRSSSQNESLILDSDQELLGFDSTGTPIIATHTRASVKPLLVDVLDTAPVGSLAGPPTSALSARRQQVRQKSIREDRTSGGRTLVAQGVATNEPAQRQVEVAPSGGDAKSETRTAEVAGQAREGDASGRPQQPPAASDGKEQTAATDKSESGEAEESPTATATTTTTTTTAVEERRLIEQAAKVRKASSQGDLMSELSERLSSRRQQTVDLATGTGKAVLKAEKQVDVGGDDVATTTKQRAKLQPRRAVKSASSDSSAASSNKAGEEDGEGSANNNNLRDMKNGELLEKQSIFAITYSGLATNKPPTEA